MVAPPSLPLIMRAGSRGSIHSAWWSPWGPRSVVNVLPPSIDLRRAVLRTYTPSEFLGSANTCVKYQARCRISWSSLVRVQLAPPSSERNSPPESASTSAHTRSWSKGETARPSFPMSPLGRPLLRVISVQLSPPSVDLKNPLPAPPETSSQGRRTACHSPAYRMRGLTASSAKSIAPVLPLRYRTLSQVLPPSLLRNTPRVVL